MKFFLDTADLAEIEEAASWGALAGVTTNPSLYAKIGGKLDGFHNHMKRICDIVGPECPVSAESVAMTRDEIVADGRKLAEIAPNIVVKIPTMVEGLAATHTLAAEGIPVNMTLCFSVPQALLAARAGARYISPFIGRFDDISEDGLEQVGNIVTAINNYDFTANTANGEQIEIDRRLRAQRQPRHAVRAHGRRHRHRPVRRAEEDGAASADRPRPGLLHEGLGEGS